MQFLLNHRLAKYKISLSLFPLAKLLLFLISTRYVPPFAEIQGFFKIKIRRSSLQAFLKYTINRTSRQSTSTALPLPSYASASKDTWDSVLMPDTKKLNANNPNRNNQLFLIPLQKTCPN
nr:MAG TPA: hypothetical protein [Inoviridae sp.]